MDNFSQQPMMSNLPPTPPTQINPVQAPAQTMAKPKAKMDEKKKFTIIIAAVSAVALISAILLAVVFVKYNEAKTDVDEKIEIAVAKAKDEQAEALEAEFSEREKDPFKDFAGPEDYGALSFKYPRTWSVYIAADASKGGDFEAYLNPGEVYTVSNTTINALRVKIVNKNTETVKASYQRSIESGKLRPEEITINGINATHYSGTIPGTEFVGHIVLLRIRDKTAILQTDSELFINDYNKILETISFNE